MINKVLNFLFFQFIFLRVTVKLELFGTRGLHFVFQPAWPFTGWWSPLKPESVRVLTISFVNDTAQTTPISVKTITEVEPEEPPCSHQKLSERVMLDIGDERLTVERGVHGTVALVLKGSVLVSKWEVAMEDLWTFEDLERVRQRVRYAIEHYDRAHPQKKVEHVG